MYEQISSEWNDKQRISFFAHLFTRVNQSENVLRLMGEELTSHEIRYIYNGLTDEKLDSIKKKVYGKKLKELLEFVYESDNAEGFVGIIDIMNAWNKIEFVPNEKMKELYLMSNSREAGRLWVDSLDNEETANFESSMIMYLEFLKPMIAFEICIYAWQRADIPKEQITAVVESFSRKNAKDWT